MGAREDLELCATRREPGRYDMNGIMLEINPGSDILVLSCSGVVPENSIVYAMENSTERIATNKLFICDKRSLWYYYGIEGVSSSFDDTVSVVGSIVSALKPSLTCAIGTSGGGYMAMALTSLLGLNRALAMSPQTSIRKRERDKLRDNRWRANMDAIHKTAAPYDIKELVAGAQNSTFSVIYPRLDKLDAAHARRLSGMANVDLFEFDVEDHNVAAQMRSIGALEPCLDIFITSDEEALSPDLGRFLSGCGGRQAKPATPRRRWPLFGGRRQPGA